MRSLWITKHGGPNVMEIRDTPDPSPAAGQIRVRTKACGLNFAEVMARQGLYPDAPKPLQLRAVTTDGMTDYLGVVQATAPASLQFKLTAVRGGSRADIATTAELQPR